MKKIKTVFKIDRETSVATPEVMPGADWVLRDEGVATLKVDGSACMIKDGVLYKRYDRKLKSEFMKKLRANPDFVVTEDMFNVLPDNAIPCEEKPDPVTYHHPHWVAVDINKPEDAFHIKALDNATTVLEDGTYELVGPKINGNPYNLTELKLVKHGSEIVDMPDRSFEGIKATLEKLNGEGVVFYHPNGEMFKIRRRDFAFEWGKEDPRNSRDKKKK